jgi:helix-turn-helix protein
MSERETFGPSLRRKRIERGVSVNHIAAVTKVSVDLWMGLERNDLSHWPTGLYARAYIREYALQIGADPDATVDDFCRWFPQGDRRAERLVRNHAAIVGHDLEWTDDLAAGLPGDRRARAADKGTEDKPPFLVTHIGRMAAVGVDIAAIGLMSGAVATLTPIGLAKSVAFCAIAYHAVAVVALGCTPAMWAIDTYLAHKHPAVARPRARFVWVPERTER